MYTFCIIGIDNPLNISNISEDEFKIKALKWSYDKKLIQDKSVSEILDIIEKTGEDTLRYGAFSYIATNKSLFVLNIPLSDSEAIAKNHASLSFQFGTYNDGVATLDYYESKFATSYKKTKSDILDKEEDFKTYLNDNNINIDLGLFKDSGLGKIDYSFNDAPSTFMQRALKRRPIKNDIDSVLGKYCF